MAEMIQERQKTQGLKRAEDMYGPQNGNKLVRPPPRQPRHAASDEI